MKDDLATLFDDRLSVDIIFSDIVSLSDYLGYDVKITTLTPTTMPTSSNTCPINDANNAHSYANK